ncbi:MAG: 4Fe-4S dicluster domain-containing protein, partial [Planctomycetota bacterium]
NAAAYARSVIDEPRYAREKNRKLPRKIGSRLALFDCITCDKCVPVCPNDANFTFTLPPAEIPRVRLLRRGDRWETEEHGTIVIAARHQIGNFADLCNDCGNCDVFCPEDGGPYKIKPRFFGTREGWADPAAGDGFFIETQGERVRVAGRFEGNEFHAAIEDGRVDYSGDGFAIRFDPRDPPGTAKGEASVPVDLTWFRILDLLQRSILSASEVNYISCRG